MVTAATDIAGLRQLWKLAFGDTDEFLDSFFGTAFSPDRHLSIRLEDTVAAALYWFDCEYQGRKAAYVYAVATHPNFRGRGLCRQLMGKTHDLLKAQGYEAVLLVPQDEGLRKMYAAMAYQDATSVCEFTCDAAQAVALSEVNGQEYADLRRKFLPEGGVVQEGENFRFLSTYARFYAGADFVAAVSGEQIIELLGNRNAAAGILGTLGKASGNVRMPGEEIPYAMFLPLKEDVPAPSYFGFAFD